ncbi:hypothetical protein DFH27DRAFT_48035 [Peziza echinospora]|nr:hypothetical protein DFH27DRAFT_48035 [Peziza echinospora]
MARLIFTALTGIATLATVLARPASDGNSLLFYNLTTGAEGRIARDNGYTVVELGPSEWASLTTADASTYKAIVFGDPFCTGVTPGILEGPESNRATWSPAVTGNVIVIGTDPAYHLDLGYDVEAGTLMKNAINFSASSKGKTGLYISLSCYYASAPETTVTVLDQFGEFRVRGDTSCSDDVHIVAEHPAFAGMTDASLSNWACSVHELITTNPPEFAPLAIARNATGTGAREFSDGSFGVPYIVARGVRVPKCGDKIIDDGEECDDGNVVNGDGCSSTCRIEKPPVDKCERCNPAPGRDKCHITAPCSNTPFGTMCACRAGYRAAGDAADRSTQWRLEFSRPGHEHRVYVTPGRECDTLCDKWVRNCGKQVL